jgi:hypothetical protein
MENRSIQKIPLNPPLLKGENTRKDAGQAGMTFLMPHGCAEV